MTVLKLKISLMMGKTPTLILTYNYLYTTVFAQNHNSVCYNIHTYMHSYYGYMCCNINIWIMLTRAFLLCVLQMGPLHCFHVNHLYNIILKYGMLMPYAHMLIVPYVAYLSVEVMVYNVVHIYLIVKISLVKIHFYLLHMSGICALFPIIYDYISLLSYTSHECYNLLGIMYLVVY